MKNNMTIFDALRWKAFFVILGTLIVLLLPQVTSAIMVGDLLGDLDYDGDVDMLTTGSESTPDYSIFRLSLGAESQDQNYNQDADYTFDGIVDYDDYQKWFSYYRSFQAGDPVYYSVPEPATLTLMGLGLLTLSGIARNINRKRNRE